MDSTTLHYLFSAIAQSAAAFAAFVAVFAIFRLQANDNDIEEKYKEVRRWLIQKKLGEYEIYNKILSMPKKIIKAELKKMTQLDQITYGAEVNSILEDIKETEGYTGKLVYDASRPLKEWAFIFLLSLLGLSIVSNSKIWGTLFAWLILIIIILTLIDTKKFIQKSLNLQKNNND